MGIIEKTTPNSAPNRVPNLRVLWPEILEEERDRLYRAWREAQPSPTELGCRAPNCRCESPCDAMEEPEPPEELDAAAFLAAVARLEGLQ